MKKTLLLLAALGAMNAFPVPTYYTFTGKINFVPQDQGGYAAAHGIRAGNAVTYVFAVDTAVNGFTKSKGAKLTKPDSINEGTGYRADYYFDSLIAPSLFSPAVTDSSSGSFFGFHTASKLGANFRYAAAFQTIIGDNKHFTQVIINIGDATATTFLPVVGAQVTASEAYSDSSAAASSASMTMTLTGVSATRPVIGIRPTGPMRQGWMQADLRNGALVLRNRSGGRAEASILGLSGKTLQAISMEEYATMPLAGLPRGLYLLRMESPGQGGPVLRAFMP
ncbi:MAG: hypothetical protein JWP91_183 [Fibrobacteres bacterium]|nr:hypothetical protein [Fibrobacterota bacterium]